MATVQAVRITKRLVKNQDNPGRDSSKAQAMTVPGSLYLPSVFGSVRSQSCPLHDWARRAARHPDLMRAEPGVHSTRSGDWNGVVRRAS